MLLLLLLLAWFVGLTGLKSLVGLEGLLLPLLPLLLLLLPAVTRIGPDPWWLRRVDGVVMGLGRSSASLLLLLLLLPVACVALLLLFASMKVCCSWLEAKGDTMTVLLSLLAVWVGLKLGPFTVGLEVVVGFRVGPWPVAGVSVWLPLPLAEEGAALLEGLWECLGGNGEV